MKRQIQLRTQPASHGGSSSKPPRRSRRGDVDAMLRRPPRRRLGYAESRTDRLRQPRPWPQGAGGDPGAVLTPWATSSTIACKTAYRR